MERCTCLWKTLAGLVEGKVSESWRWSNIGKLPCPPGLELGQPSECAWCVDKDDTQAGYLAGSEGQGCKPMTNWFGGCERFPARAIENFQRHFLRRDDGFTVIEESKFYGVDNAFGAKVHFQPVGFIRRTLCRPAIWRMDGVAVVAIIDGFERCLRISEGCRKPWVVVAIVVDSIV